MWDVSLLDLVLITIGVFLTMALISCLCCLFMKISDRKMKSDIVQMANKKGVTIDLDKLDPKSTCQSPHSNENCTIIVPNVGIIL